MSIKAIYEKKLADLYSLLAEATDIEERDFLNNEIWNAQCILKSLA